VKCELAIAEPLPAKDRLHHMRDPKEASGALFA
jgi:hypothetical protein